MLTARPRTGTDEHPKIIRDIQELTGKLHHEYTQTRTPINDDNHVLHRFCAKLEFLLQSCLKEKSFLGSSKNFWQWLYDSLKRQKGLKDGLRYVRANKELRTNIGRGRALIRYSLVHQTLGDSMQNCVMDESSCQRYLKPSCVLKTRSCADAFVVALYDLNDVLFDLNSQGFNLDSSWPTFASQHFSNQWHAPFRSNSFDSLNSFATHSSLMNHPHFRSVRGSRIIASSQAESSDPPSVDHRVEELVLELDQSDKKIKEQQTTIERLESDMEAMSRAGNESQDILAHVISERENRNQELVNAMERMTAECELREKHWQEKYDELQSKSRIDESNLVELREKIVRLETDKRNLEETVSMKMTKITESFNSSNDSSTKEDMLPVQASTPVTLTPQPLLHLEAENEMLKTKLVDLESKCNLYQENSNTLRTEKLEISRKFDAEKGNLKASLTAEFEEKLEVEMTENTRRSKDFFHAEMSSVIEFLNNFVAASDVQDDKPINLQLNSVAYKNLLSSILSLKLKIRHLSERVVESNNRESENESEYKNELEQLKDEVSTLTEERELLENENAKLREQFHTLNDELRFVKEQLSALQGSILNSDESRILEAEQRLQEKEDECAGMMMDLDKLRQEVDRHEEEKSHFTIVVADKDR